LFHIVKMLQNCYNSIVLDRYIYKLQQEDFYYVY